MLISNSKAGRRGFGVWSSGGGGSFEPDLLYPMVGIILAHLLKTKSQVQGCGGPIIQSGFYREAGSVIRFKYKFQQGTANTASEIVGVYHQALDMGGIG